MVFKPDIPQAANDLSVSQGDLLENYSQLNTQFGVNHVAFDVTSGDAGKHNLVTFVEQAADPTSAANEAIIFATDDAGDTELAIKPENNGASYQITKDGYLNLGIIPFAAVNFDNALTLHSSFGVTSVTKPGLDGRYIVNFDAATVTLLAGDNDYFWSVSGFTTSATKPCISQVTNNATYSTVVTASSCSFDFKDAANALTAINRASIVFWRFQ